MSPPYPEPLVSIRGLRKEYVQRDALSRSKITIHALTDVNLTILRGTTLALVGESGAGKSTLVRCLALIERPTAGEIWFEGSDLLKLPRKALVLLRRCIQIIFQDPTSALNPAMTAGEIIGEPLVIQRQATRKEIRQRVLTLMERVGLPAKWEHKLPLEFSGGQRQRLAIARALILEPRLLILDESLSHLDLANQELILRLLAELQAAGDLTYVHVSHDLRAVSGLADEIAVLHEGRIVEQKSTPDLVRSPEHPYTRDLLAAMPSVESICDERFAREIS